MERLNYELCRALILPICLVIVRKILREAFLENFTDLAGVGADVLQPRQNPNDYE